MSQLFRPETREMIEALPAVSPDEAASLLDLLVEQVVDYAIFVLDRNGNIASWNVGAQRIKGYLSHEIVGKPYEVFFTDEDRRRGKPGHILAQAAEIGRYQEEGWRVRKDGSRFWASALVTALRGSGGELKGFAKITRDLTERREADEEARQVAEERAARRQAELDAHEVRRSRDQLDLILKGITEGVTAQTPDGRLIFANDAAARLCGFDSASAMLGASQEKIMSTFAVYREDGTPFPIAELPGRRALQGETATSVVRFRARQTGEERWSIVSAGPVVDADGRVDLAVNIFREITERLRVEAAWQFLADASAALGSSLSYENTLKQVADLAVPRIADWCSVEILGADGTLAQLAVAHLDPTKRELAKEWRRRWPPRSDSVLYRVVGSCVPELHPEITREMIEAATPDMEQRHIVFQLGLSSAMIVPLVVGQKAIGVVSFFAAESRRNYAAQDLILAVEVARRASLAVENARAYSEARSAVEARDNFLAIASHELRTPLSALTLLMTSLLRAAQHDRLMQLGPDGLRERIAKADRQARQLARLVDRLLDVSNLSARDLPLEREKADLSEITRDVVSRYEDAAVEKGTHVELQISGSAVGLWDRSKMDQVITNLVGNALKYGAGSPVTVSISTTGSRHVRLSVCDQGPGIAAEHQERIFGQYERASPSGNLPGMGLGLWLVRRIVAAHGGVVSLESSPGQGATFTVILPLTDDGATVAEG